MLINLSMLINFRYAVPLLILLCYGPAWSAAEPPGQLKVFLGIVSRYEPGSQGGREIVQEVVSGGPAERAGLRKGDQILGIGGRPHRATSLSALLESLGFIEPGVPVQLDVLRSGKRMTLDLVPEPSSPDRQAALRRFLDGCRERGGCNELCAAEESPVETSLRSLAATHGEIELTFGRDPRTQEPILAGSKPALPAAWDFHSDPVFSDGPVLASIRKLLLSRSEVKAVYRERQPGRFGLELKL